MGDEIAGKHVAFIGYNPQKLAPSVWLEGNGTFCQALLFRQAPPAVPATPVPALEDPLSTLRAVRVVPAVQDGAVVGLRLFNIRPNTVLAALGLENGDRLDSINGLSLSSPEKALQAYARLSTAKRLTLKLSRRGKPLEIGVNII